MVRILKNLILIFLIVAFYSCNENKTTQIPINEFFKTPQKVAFKISPDGKYISYLKKYNNKQNIFIKSLADGKEVMATSFTDFSVRGDYNWTYENQIVFGPDSKDDQRLLVLDIHTLKTKTILAAGKASIHVLNKNKHTPDIITISMNKRDSANFDVYRLNIKNGDLKTYLVNPGNITEFFVDADGKIRLIKAADGVDETILYRANDRSAFKAIIKNNFRNYVRPVAFTGVKKNFYALSNVGRDKTAFVEINAEDGKEGRVIYANNTTDVRSVDYSRSKNRLESVAWEEAKIQRQFFDADTKALYQNLYNLLKGYEINISDRDTAEDKFIVQPFTDRSPTGTYLYERSANKLTKLTENSSIDPAKLCAKKPISYTTNDGFVINGYLTLPLGDNQTNLPVIVMPHAGLFGMRDSWNYSPDVQFFANRGYAVLQVNYRGSSGYGKVFYSAGFKEVGGKIQEDITDGVNWLIANKIANPKKIAMYGRGFGGFSALYAASFNPKLYSCVIVQNGVINLLTYIQTAPAYYRPQRQKMYATIGDPEKDLSLLRAISPVNHPDKPKAPIFFLQDANDSRANIVELNHYIRELQKRNISVKYSLYKNERGSVSSENRRKQNYADIEKFLEINMHFKP
ncbi:prolyl oligopeptidase family serine peptidase [Mucilaginibacter sp. UYCu711]|uniref:alpha/beta hydrolase family protein n=1 Tax=Mucilaginibacter sp. UYCu711 TaxID=3156339 RepID=UPI003D234ED6